MINFRPTCPCESSLFAFKGSYIFLILVLNSFNVNDCMMSFARLFQSRMVLGNYDFENISFLIIGKRNELFRRN